MVVPKDDLLRMVGQVVPWQRFTYKLLKYYKGKARMGRPPYDPALLLKMLLLAYLYDLSECAVERFCSRDLPAKYFSRSDVYDLGIAVDAPVPDHSDSVQVPHTGYKRRIPENRRLEAFQDMLQELIRIAQESGVVFGSLQIIDNTHTVANVNVQKDDRRQKKGKRPRDPNAGWGAKHTRTVRDEKGQKKKVREYFYGYRAHVSFSAETPIQTLPCTCKQVWLELRAQPWYKYPVRGTSPA